MLAKKKKSVKISTLRNRADKLYQELGRLLYGKCIVCGKQTSCLHHYIPKSRSVFLRYNLKNGIPLCAGCHMRHHNGEPFVQNKINEIKGQEWLDDLTTEHKKGLYFKPTRQWYNEKIESLKKIYDEK